MPIFRNIFCPYCPNVFRYGLSFCGCCGARFEYGPSFRETTKCFEAGWLLSAALAVLLNMTSTIDLRSEFMAIVAPGLVVASGFIVATIHLHLTIDRVRAIRAT